MSNVVEQDFFTDSHNTNLTQYQWLIWLGQKQNEQIPLYNMIKTFRFHGQIDVARFQAAFSRLVRNTDSLRTIVITDQDWRPQQVVKPDIGYELEVLQLNEPEYARWLDIRRKSTFKLDECLFDSALIQLSDNDYIWYFSQHHIVSDVTSFKVMYERLLQFYHTETTNFAVQLPQFSEYISHERNNRDSESYRQSLEYWNSLIADVPPLLEFYGKNSLSVKNTSRRMICHIDAEHLERLHAFIQEKGIRTFSEELSYYNVFLALYSIWLYRITQQNQSNIGTPFQNRATPDHQQIAGLLIEMGLIAVEVDETTTFRNLIQQISKINRTRLLHTQAGITQARYIQAFNVILNLMMIDYPAFGDIPVTVSWIHSGYSDSNHPLRLQIYKWASNQDWTFAFDFNIDVFDETYQSLAIQQFTTLLDAALVSPDIPIHQLNMLASDEFRSHVLDFNQSARDFPADKTVLMLFEEQAEATPNATAVSFGDTHLSYQDLMTRVGQTAQQLHASGVNKGSCVAIYLNHSVEMVIGLLAILKAGGAYVPLDLSYPRQRIDGILNGLSDETDSVFLLTDSTLIPRLQDISAQVIAIDTLLKQQITSQANLDSVQVDDLAYIMFTSGSTGQPKGVMIEHLGLTNYVWWAAQQYTEGEAMSFALYSSLAFDLTVTSIFVPLIAGGRIVIYDEPDNNRGLVITDVFSDNQVDVVKLTPAHLSLLKQIDLSKSKVRCLIVGGEDFKTALAHDMSQRFSHQVNIYNEYGPTEAVVGCMIHRYDSEIDNKISVPIGIPSANKQIYILDDYNQPVSTGVIGEICISGIGIARGYLNRPQLTAERFVPDPFNDGQTMYRTGDLARWSPDGQLEFLGRRDDQVKVGSIRIELGEIEHALLTHNQIQEAVVHVISQTHEQYSETKTHCIRCGLPDNLPDVAFDDENICSLCRSYELYQDKVQEFFRPYTELRALVEQAKTTATGSYDALVLLSGGKDSTFMLYQLAAMGLRTLAFTLDNGYISDEAKQNIDRVTTHLGIEHIYGKTPSMNAIFVDSLQRFSNVCNGCFKTIYTLSINLAYERGIQYIFTGLSRGQFFETRLTPDIFLNDAFDPTQFDRAIIEARKAYHRIPDAVNDNLDTSIFADDDVFEQVQIIDFYRYSDASLDYIYEFMSAETPWIRPSDTGRSTNCLINDLGIYFHKRERGYHNYALPYSWDVRLGHKNRESAMEELDDDLDLTNVEQMLADIGYTEIESQSQKRLVAYYVSHEELTTTDLQTHLASILPDYMIPSLFMQLPQLPLNRNGKVNRSQLPHPTTKRPNLATDYVMPRNAIETQLARIWIDALRLERVGINDNFFQLGGDSITNFQIVSRARKVGIYFEASDIFKHQTIAELSVHATTMTPVTASQSPIVGNVLLTPIQQWFFEQNTDNISHWNQSLRLDLPAEFDQELLRQAFDSLMQHHDMLRVRYFHEDNLWQQTSETDGVCPTLTVHDISSMKPAEQAKYVDELENHLQTQLDIESGLLMQAEIVRLDTGTKLIWTIHHLVVDAVSWWILVDDLTTIYQQRLHGEQVTLPPKTTSFQTWATLLVEYARTHAQWIDDSIIPTAIPLDYDVREQNLERDAVTVSDSLTAEETQLLLHSVHEAYNTQTQEILLAALGQTICEWTQSSNTRIDIEGHGRETVNENIDLSRTVGWFTSLYPILMNYEDGIEDAIIATKETLRSLPNNGLDYGLLRYLSAEGQSVSKTDSEILFNYLGAFDTNQAQDSLFKVTTPFILSRSDHTVRPYIFEVHAININGELQVSWVYNRTLHTDETVRRLLDLYFAKLRGMIDYCMTEASRRYTPSDFADAMLGQDDLDDILSEFGE